MAGQFGLPLVERRPGLVPLTFDGAAWAPVFPDDGIADSGHETYTVDFGSLAPGEHTISLRSFDSSGNIGTLSVTVRR